MSKFENLFAVKNLTATVAAIGMLSTVAYGDDKDGKPDLFEIKDANSSIYIMGTVHAMRPDVDWEKAILKEKITASDKIFFELDMDMPNFEQQVAGKFGSKFMLTDGSTLPSYLSEEEYEKVKAIFTAKGIPEAQLQMFAPWAAAVTLAQFTIMDAGLNPAAGIDNVLKQHVADAGKDITGLETIDDQLAALAGDSYAEQADFLKSGIADYEKGVEGLNTLINAWAADDIAKMEELMMESLPIDKGIGKKLITDRNNAWMITLDKALADDVTSFVAVGALHLHGPVGLLKQFEDKGYTVVRH